MRAATVVHASLAGLVLSFIACFILLVIASLTVAGARAQSINGHSDGMVDVHVCVEGAWRCVRRHQIRVCIVIASLCKRTTTSCLLLVLTAAAG